MPIRILIADDHRIVRDGLRMMFESQDDMTVVGEACTGLESVVQAEALLPDVVIMDISMPELNGIEATAILKTRLPSIKVIILSMHNTTDYICRARYAGAKAYIIKESGGIELRNAVRSVMKGYYVTSSDGGPPADLEEIKTSPLDKLSGREREILQLVAEGNTSATIAELLGLSPKSVETYRSRLMLKLELSNIPALVKFALLHGVVSL
jgi:DNA-binding NarL/FixJ family response regulator